MEPEAEQVDDPPLVEPRLLEALRNRPRLIDFGYREMACESMCESVKERRKPAKVADRLSKQVAEAAQDTGARVTKQVAEEPIRKAARRRL